MFQYHYLNKISPKGTALWTEAYQKTEDIAQAEAILVRSAAMHDMSFSSNLLAIGRAGAGVNNIPLDESTEEGKIEAVNRLKLANALLLTSQGIAFLHAGQERGRTKTAFTTAGTDDCETIGNFVKNSYDSSDNINNFVWNISDLNKDLLEYTKNLISLRKNNSAFTISTQDEVMTRISLLGEFCDDFLILSNFIASVLSCCKPINNNECNNNSTNNHIPCIIFNSNNNINVIACFFKWCA